MTSTTFVNDESVHKFAVNHLPRRLDVHRQSSLQH